MLGWVKCGACGRQFRPKRGRRSDICPDCERALIQKQLLSTAPSVEGQSELNMVERRVREAQYQQSTARADRVSAMEEKVARWQQLNRLLNAPPNALSPSERNKYESMQRELAKSDAVQSFLRRAKHDAREDRKRE